MIGYYVHHHGVGHRTRAAAVSEAVAATSGEPVTILSSAARPDPWDGEWVALDLDVAGDGEVADDVTAGGGVHWAPTNVAGLTSRMASVAEWVAHRKPRLVVVDISVEVAVFVRLLGVPVVVVASPGERVDRPHTLAYTMATRILAPWSRDVYDPHWLHPFADKTTYVGSISRFAGRSRSALRPGSVVVLGGAGGSAVNMNSVSAAASSNPRFSWYTAGVAGGPWIADPWPLLSSAEVVVTSAGQNAVADVACAAVPAVVVPQDRPFGEQRATARALADRGIAVTADGWPAPTEWSDLLRATTTLGRDGWRELRTEGAAQRAADVLGAV